MNTGCIYTLCKNMYTENPPAPILHVRVLHEQNAPRNANLTNMQAFHPAIPNRNVFKRTQHGCPPTELVSLGLFRPFFVYDWNRSC